MNNNFITYSNTMAFINFKAGVTQSHQSVVNDKKSFIQIMTSNGFVILPNMYFGIAIKLLLHLKQ